MPVTSLLSVRDIASDVGGAINSANGVKTTYSSWDTCMTKAYCKWPVIIGIIVGSLIILSILFCAFRCLCCGVECCCGCFRCCNACCPSPRRSREKTQQANYAGQQPMQPVYQPVMVYPQAFGGPQTATFETGSKAGPAKYNPDALPAMPSWSHAVDKHIEDDSHDNNELDKLDSSTADSRHSLLPPPTASQQPSPAPRYQNMQGQPMPGQSMQQQSMLRNTSYGSSHAPNQGPYSSAPLQGAASPYGMNPRASPGPYGAPGGHLSPAQYAPMSPYGPPSPQPPMNMHTQMPYSNQQVPQQNMMPPSYHQQATSPGPWRDV